VLEDGMFPDRTFNAILMLDSIEHIPDPHAMALVAKKILAPRGVLVLVTPDSASMSAGLLRSRWMHLFADHVNIYSPRSTRYLFEHHGFEILRIGWAPKFVTIDMLASHLACHPDIAAAGPLSFLARLMAPVKDAVFPFNVGELFAVVRKPA
jgi:SAM-dependent methyltransferase